MEQSHKHSQLPKNTPLKVDVHTKCGYGDSSGSESGSESENSTSDSQEFSIRETNFDQGQLKLKIATKKRVGKKQPTVSSEGKNSSNGTASLEVSDMDASLSAIKKPVKPACDRTTGEGLAPSVTKTTSDPTRKVSCPQACETLTHGVSTTCEYPV